MAIAIKATKRSSIVKGTERGGSGEPIRLSELPPRVERLGEFKKHGRGKIRFADNSGLYGAVS